MATLLPNSINMPQKVAASRYTPMRVAFLTIGFLVLAGALVPTASAMQIMTGPDAPQSNVTCTYQEGVLGCDICGPNDSPELYDPYFGQDGKYGGSFAYHEVYYSPSCDGL